jgi:hypothetical protein
LVKIKNLKNRKVPFFGQPILAIFRAPTLNAKCL